MESEISAKCDFEDSQSTHSMNSNSFEHIDNANEENGIENSIKRPSFDDGNGNGNIAVGRKISIKSKSDNLDAANDKYSNLVVDQQTFHHQSTEQRIDLLSVERTNLVNIMKLIVKDLIETPIKHGRVIDLDNVSLRHFLILIEYVMRHGLKSRKGLLGFKKELWNLLELVERFHHSAKDITASSRSLPGIKTSLGRARAWIRLALMGKKLSDYFSVLVNNRETILNEFYEEGSLMLNEEATIISGLLVGINILDCNLCLKGEDLDLQSNVIDFSYYLKDIKNLHFIFDENSDEGPKNITTILDQKNYIEELNRHLSATVSNLQQKVNQLKTENLNLRKLHSSSYQIISSETGSDDKGLNSDTESSLSDHHGIEKRLNEEVQSKEKLQKELEILQKELDLQLNLKMEIETAKQLLERDVLEKQDTLISLRKQLEDVKAINLQMYSKLQECEVTIKNKTDQITYLENKTTCLTNNLLQLETKLTQSEKKRSSLENQNQKLLYQLTEKEQKSDLKSERETHSSLRSLIDEQQIQITALEFEVDELKPAAEELEKLKKRYSSLEKRCADYELSLEELGYQLQNSKLEVDNLKENSFRLKEAVWTSDKEASFCKSCSKSFSVARRKHHCRNCGEIFCNDCSNNKMPLPSSAKPVRVCDFCYTLLLERYSAT